MKQLTCEMCGSNDLVKQDGVFVCQSCGCKYSVEEAKKMMVEGTVEITGTVKIDHSVQHNNNIDNARKALSNKNWKEAEKYYSMIKDSDPSNDEATFYVEFCRVMESLLINDIFERNKRFDVLCNTIVSFCTQYEADKKHQQLLQMIEKDIFVLINTDFVCTTETGVWGTSDDSEETVKLFCKVLATISTLITFEILPKYKSDVQTTYNLHKYLVKCYESLLVAGCIGFDEKTVQNNLLSSHKAMASIDHSHIIPNNLPNASNRKSGCYIATCVYGTYDCPQVWTLRRYRDDTLGSTWYGRAFIRFYYATSPTLVKWFGNTNWFKNMWKPKLDKMVCKLNTDGVENTPYQDKEW